MDNLNTTEQLLKDSLIRVTKQRINLLDKLMNSSRPFTANDINEEMLHKTDVNLVTIYRFLGLLSEKNIIRMIGEFNGKQYYEFSDKHPMHPHFFCEKCHNIFCLKYLSADDFIKLSDYAPNSKINEIKITLGGICENCKL